MPKENQNKDEVNNLSTAVLTPTLTDMDLSLTDFPEPTFVIPGLIPPGLMMLAAKPKAGKSILMCNLCYSLANGGRALETIPVNQCKTLYLALEESEGRLKAKMAKIRAANPPTNNVHFAFKWPRMDEGGMQDLAKWVELNPEVRLIVIDTFARFRSLKSNGALYNRDYQEISKIKKMADEKSVAIVLVHHLRKASAKDQVDLITGSSGLTGAVDTVAILDRERSCQEANLFVSGRDVEEKTLAIRFDPVSFSWSLLGQAEEYRISKERQEIIKLLKSATGPLKLKEIASNLGKKEPGIHKHLSLLIESGFVEQPGYGLYQLRKIGKNVENGEGSETAEAPIILN